MITIAAFMAAACCGAILRSEATSRWNRQGGFPLGTLAVNVTGSFLLGLISEVSRPVFTIIGVAGLGAFTTFSSFASESVALYRKRHYSEMALYVSTTLVAGIAAAAVGLAIAHRSI